MKYLFLFFSIISLAANQLFAAVNPIYCDVSRGIETYAEWLSWKAHRSGLNYAVVGQTISGIPEGEIENVGTDEHSGLRVGLFRDCGRWDIGLRYTLFCPDQKGEVIREKEADIIPTRVAPALITDGYLPENGLKFSESKYRINLHVIDIENGSQWCSYGWGIGFRPFGGVRIAIAEQNLDTIYNTEAPNISTSAQALSLQEQVDLQSYGLYGGVEAEVDCMIGVNFFFRSSLGVCCALVDASTKTYDFSGGVVGEKILSAKKQSNCVVTQSECAAGGRWHCADLFCADWMIQVAYEFHEWCGIPDFINFDDSNAKGSVARSKSNLGFSGLAIRLQALF